MAVRTTNVTFFNLPFCLCSAFSKTNIQMLISPHMVKIKRTRIVKSAINTTNRCFIFTEPRSKFRISSLFVSAVTRSALRFCTVVIGAAIFWVIRAVSWFTVSLSHLVWVPFSPAAICFSLTPSFFLDVHREMVSYNCYPLQARHFCSDL